MLNELETCSKREIESEGNRERAETQIHTHKVQLGARSQASENQFRPEREKSERSSRSAYIDDGVVVVVVGGYIHPSPFCVSASVKGSETTRKGGEGPAPGCSPSSFFSFLLQDRYYSLQRLYTSCEEEKESCTLELMLGVYDAA